MYLIADAGDEGLDVQLRRTGLLAGSVCTLEAATGLPQSRSLTERGVLNVIKVVALTNTSLEREREGMGGGG